MLNEKVSEALKKRMKMMREKIKCEECGCGIPVYPGRYPTKCPECGASLGESKDKKMVNDENLTPWEQYIQYNENITSFKV